MPVQTLVSSASRATRRVKAPRPMTQPVEPAALAPRSDRLAPVSFRTRSSSAFRPDSDRVLGSSEDAARSAVGTAQALAIPTAALAAPESQAQTTAPRAQWGIGQWARAGCLVGMGAGLGLTLGSLAGTAIGFGVGGGLGALTGGAAGAVIAASTLGSTIGTVSGGILGAASGGASSRRGPMSRWVQNVGHKRGAAIFGAGMGTGIVGGGVTYGASLGVAAAQFMSNPTWAWYFAGLGATFGLVGALGGAAVGTLAGVLGYGAYKGGKAAWRGIKRWAARRRSASGPQKR